MNIKTGVTSNLSLLLIFIVIGQINLPAQESFSTTGGEAQGYGGSISYTIGQMVYHNPIGIGGSLLQSVQQPYEINAVTYTLSPQPVCYWTFNHGNANDDGILGLNGATKDVSFSRGIDCEIGAYFNGITSGIDFGDNLNSVFIDGTFSITLWVKPYSLVSNDGYKDPSMIIEKWRSSTYTDNTFILYTNSLQTYNKTLFFPPLQTNIWSHIAVICNNGKVGIYINGTLVASDSSFTFNACSYPLMLGTLHNNRYKYYGGMDDVRIYNVALTENQLNDIINSNKFYNQYIPRYLSLFEKQSVLLGFDSKVGYSYHWSSGEQTSWINVEPKAGLSEKTIMLTIATDFGCEYTDTTTIRWDKLSTDIAAEWNFNDSALLSNKAVLNNVFVTEGVGCSNGFYFNGNNSNISLGDTLNNIFTGKNFTISVWVYLEDSVDVNYNDISMILSKWHTAYAYDDDNCFILYVNSFVFGQKSNNQYFSIKWPTPEMYKWHHYVVVQDGQFTKVYIDGNLVGNAKGYSYRATSYPLVVGGLHNNRYSLKGKIDNLRIYNKPLSDIKIEYLNKIGYLQHYNKFPEVINVDKGSSLTLDAGEGFTSYLWADGSTNQTITFNNIQNDILDFFVLTKDSIGCYADTFDIIVIQSNNIKESNSNNNTIIYPNPAKDRLNIQFINELPSRVEIFNMNGQLLRTVTPGYGLSNTVTINVGEYSKGVYLLKVNYNVKIEYYKVIIE